MKRSSVRALAVCGLLSMVAVSGCGEDRADPGPAIASCNAYCAAYVAAACAPATYASVDTCKGYECGDIATSPSQCVGAFKAYYDCASALAKEDLCCDTAVAPAKMCGGDTGVALPCAAPFAMLLTCSGR